MFRSLNGHSVSSFQLNITQNLSKSRLGFGSNIVYTLQQEKSSGRKRCLRSVVDCISPGTFSADFTSEQTMATNFTHLGRKILWISEKGDVNCQCSYILFSAWTVLVTATDPKRKEQKIINSSSLESMAYLFFQTAELREESRFNSIQNTGHEVRKAHDAELLCRLKSAPEI